MAASIGTRHARAGRVSVGSHHDASCQHAPCRHARHGRGYSGYSSYSFSEAALVKTVCIFALFLAAAVARADIAFAVPDEGRITLGVFDGSGRLVRTLHKLARQEDFRIGLNGLITNWDGKDDAGKALPAGHYHVRGYLVGNDVRVTGEEFLFNDFASDPGFPGFSRIRDFSLLESGDLLLLAESPSGPPWLARVSEERGFVWSVVVQQPKPLPSLIPASFRPTDLITLDQRASLPDFSPKLATNSLFAFLLTQDRSGIYLLENGKEVFSSPSTGCAASLAVATNDSQFFVSAPGGLTTILLTKQKTGGTDVPPVKDAAVPAPEAIAANGRDAQSCCFMWHGHPAHAKYTEHRQDACATFSCKCNSIGRDARSPWDLGDGLKAQLKESLSFPPAAFISMDADDATLIGAAPEGVWVRQGSFAKVEMPATVRSVALGMPGTFWFVGGEKEEAFVGQAGFGGEILRTLRPAPEDPKPEKIRASRTAEKFAVLESLPGLQRLRVMARSESGEWTIEWERTIRDSAGFGFVEGKPSADAGDTPQAKDIRFHLKENPLNGQKDFLTVRASFDGSGSRLVSPDGLPLVEVSSRPNLRRTAIHRGDSASSLRLLQGNGIFVEEFSISGLDDILPLDAGDVELP